MEKQEALNRLKSIEQETEKLRKIIEDADKPKNIMDRIKTYEDACNVLGLGCHKVWSDYDSVDEIAYKKLKVIIKVLNEGWIPDWKNSNEYKYYPWFEMTKKPGSGFLSSDSDGWRSLSSVSSRLAFKSRELALYAGKQFEKIYYDYMVI